ncbi:hypothetical protein [Actinobacillus equuli]|uniref:hypothetical protein n=1 Tax=Actinobacillus equuli TaxID=718 RepID=UPI00244676CF|nr:hypothetical protein [Actinobacillus equuli]WGE82654.1 DUF637 domain-containing protein [Actinobacillus equuli subsp. equuli]
MDYAQVNQQSGFNIGKTSEINVEENTHLAGGVINAEGDKANHRMKTSTLTTAEIKNRSEIKVSSVSAGVSNDMSKMAGHAMGAALSALGNMSESERSTTSSAISDNIDLQITDSDKQKALTGKTAEETLQSLNRDVENANGKVEKQDLTKLQEQQEASQIVAEMGAKAVGDLAQFMEWEEGSPQKLALHGLVGYLSAKVGGGNTAAGTLSAMSSEYINTEIANYLVNNTALTADERNAIQQASAAGLGALIGASLSGNSTEVKQSAQMALRTEKFNRQLHPEEKQRIKDLARQLAKEHGKAESYWEEQLTLVTSTMVDEKENQQVLGGINTILNDAQIYADDYKESLAIAYKTLKTEADKNQAIKWKDGNDVVLYGEKVRMFQATEKQYKDSSMFGKINYPNIDVVSRNNLNSLNEVGLLNGLSASDSKYSAELLGNIGKANRNRQDNNKVLHNAYYNYVISPKGVAEPAVVEDLLIGGSVFKVGSKAISATNKVLSKTGETLANAMVSDEAIALGIVADNQLRKGLERVVTSTRTYIGDSIKVVQNAPLKTTIGNSAATGIAATVGEIYDYTKDEKPKALTKENVINSAYSIGVDTYKGDFFGVMPIGSATLGNMVVDKVTTGDGDVGKNIATGISGAVWDEKLKASPNPFIREIFIKYSEKQLDNLSSPSEREK